MLSQSRRLLQDLKIPPIPPGRAGAAVGALLAIVLVTAVATRGRSSSNKAVESPRAPIAEHAPPTVALEPPGRQRVTPRAASPRAAASGARPAGESTGGWWYGTAGVALALALIGWGSVASHRYLPRVGSGAVPLRVVGRTSLSPKHTVYLLEVGDRVLILGAGPQGAPSVLGELTDLDRMAAASPSQTLGDAL